MNDGWQMQAESVNYDPTQLIKLTSLGDQR